MIKINRQWRHKQLTSWSSTKISSTIPNKISICSSLWFFSSPKRTKASIRYKINTVMDNRISVVSRSSNMSLQTHNKWLSTIKTTLQTTETIKIMIRITEVVATSPLRLCLKVHISIWQTSSPIMELHLTSPST